MNVEVMHDEHSGSFATEPVTPIFEQVGPSASPRSAPLRGEHWNDPGQNDDRTLTRAQRLRRQRPGRAAAVSYIYAAGAIGRLTGGAVVTATAEGVPTAVGERVAAVNGLRILGMTLGGWVTAGLFGVQVIIWIITPDALEKWIDHSAFGKKRGTGATKMRRTRKEHLKGALVEMGLAQ